MPLVRIALMQGKPTGFGKQVGEVVYRTMVDTINVPPRDNFQLITEHDKGNLVYDSGYLGISRTDGVIVIQITLNDGRTVEAKKAFCKTLADRLHEELGVHTEDVFISLGEEGELVLWKRHRAIRPVTVRGTSGWAASDKSDS